MFFLFHLMFILFKVSHIYVLVVDLVLDSDKPRMCAFFNIKYTLFSI